MRKRGKEIFIGQGGAVYGKILVILLLMGMISAGIMEYLRIYNHISQVKRGAEEAISALATDYWDRVYQSVREGYAGAYQKQTKASLWKEVFVEDRALEELSEVLGLNHNEEKEAGTGFYYRIKGFHIEVVNSNFQNKTEVLKVRATVRMEIPWKTLVSGIPNFEISLEVQSSYQRKF